MVRIRLFPLKIIVLFIFSFPSPFITYGQDSIYTEFVYGNSELDSFIIDNFVRPDDCLEFGIDFDIWIEFKVDSIGSVSNVVIKDIKPTSNKWSDSFKAKIESLIPGLKMESIRVILATKGFWIPAELDGKTTWQEIEYRIELRTPEHYNKYESVRRLGQMHTVDYIPFDVPATDPVKYYNLGVKKLNQKKYYISMKYFEKSLKMGHQNKDVYYNLGIANYLQGFNDDACKAWSRAIKLGDEEAEKLWDKNCK